MKRIVTIAALTTGVLVCAPGCRPGASGGATGPTQGGAVDAETKQKLDQQDERLTTLEGQIADIDSRLASIEELIRNATQGQREPDPNQVYSVPIAGFPSVGPANAKVTIVKAYEFACSYCEQIRPTLTALRTAYPNDLKIVYKPFIIHAEVAVIPAMAACAAHNQGKFSEMQALIWDKGFAASDLSQERMELLARQLSLDMQRYYRDITGEACLESVAASTKALTAVGTRGTPTFYVNGRHLKGAQPIEMFQRLIEEELAKADEALAAGIAAEDYYRKIVVEAGKRQL